MKPRTAIRNIKIRFHGHSVTLTDEADRRTTPEGVELWVQQLPHNGLKPMAAIPEGTLSRYMHMRPEFVSCDWDDQEEGS